MSRPVALAAAVDAATTRTRLIVRHLVRAAHGPESDALRQVGEAKRHCEELREAIGLAELRLNDAAHKREEVT